jgi:hypothetical protein
VGVLSCKEIFRVSRKTDLGINVHFYFQGTLDEETLWMKMYLTLKEYIFLGVKNCEIECFVN